MNQPRFATQESGNRREDKIDNPLELKIKRALVQSRSASFFAANRCSESGLEHILFETADDGIAFEHIQDRRMAFENLRTTLFFLDYELRHVPLSVACFRQPLLALGHRLPFCLGFKSCCLSLEHVVKQLLRR